jgi:hypothetical protein
MPTVQKDPCRMRFAGTSPTTSSTSETVTFSKPGWAILSVLLAACFLTSVGGCESLTRNSVHFARFYDGPTRPLEQTCLVSFPTNLYLAAINGPETKKKVWLPGTDLIPVMDETLFTTRYRATKPRYVQLLPGEYRLRLWYRTTGIGAVVGPIGGALSGSVVEADEEIDVSQTFEAGREYTAWGIPKQITRAVFIGSNHVRKWEVSFTRGRTYEDMEQHDGKESIPVKWRNGYTREY